MILNKPKELTFGRKLATIFLATDNKRTELEIEAMFPGRVKKLKKLMPDNGVPLHCTRNYMTKQVFREAVFDMYLLSRCGYLIFSSSSSFGLISALLSKAPTGNIFDCLSIRQRYRNALKTIVINVAPALFKRLSAR